jgi:1-phosphofructokinase
MIATITLNPALDKTVYVRGLIVGDTNRIERTEVDAGGKGINASRMLAELGAETVALGFIGGRTGAFIEHVLSQEGIKTDFVQTRVETRSYVDVQDLDGVPPTCLNERGGPITADELEKLKETVRVWARKCRVDPRRQYSTGDRARYLSRPHRNRPQGRGKNDPRRR